MEFKFQWNSILATSKVLSQYFHCRLIPFLASCIICCRTWFSMEIKSTLYINASTTIFLETANFDPSIWCEDSYLVCWQNWYIWKDQQYLVRRILDVQGSRGTLSSPIDSNLQLCLVRLPIAFNSLNNWWIKWSFGVCLSSKIRTLKERYRHRLL